MRTRMTANDLAETIAEEIGADLEQGEYIEAGVHDAYSGVDLSDSWPPTLGHLEALCHSVGYAAGRGHLLALEEDD